MVEDVGPDVRTIKRGDRVIAPYDFADGTCEFCLKGLDSACVQGKNNTMGQQHESDLVKRLEQLGIEVDVSPTVTTLSYEQIYTSGSTLEEALLTFLGETLSRYEALRTWKASMNDG